MGEPVRRKASDFDPRILEIFDGYVHGRISKREFIRDAALSVSGLLIEKPSASSAGPRPSS